jgi:hypothetical protein
MLGEECFGLCTFLLSVKSEDLTRQSKWLLPSFPRQRLLFSDWFAPFHLSLFQLSRLLDCFFNNWEYITRWYFEFADWVPIFSHNNNCLSLLKYHIQHGDADRTIRLGIIFYFCFPSTNKPQEHKSEWSNEPHRPLASNVQFRKQCFVPGLAVIADLGFLTNCRHHFPSRLHLIDTIGFTVVCLLLSMHDIVIRLAETVVIVIISLPVIRIRNIWGVSGVSKIFAGLT